jgi:hypothetical protein
MGVVVVVVVAKGEDGMSRVDELKGELDPTDTHTLLGVVV